MSVSWALQLYLCAFALLMASYLVFWILYGVVAAGVSVRYQHLIRVAKVLVLLSVASPVAFHLIPARKLPAMDWTLFRHTSERLPRTSQRHGASHQAGSLEIKASPSAEVIERRGVLTVRWLKQNAAATALFLILAGCLGFGARLFRETRRLRLLLLGAMPIRSLGRVRVVVADSIRIPFSVRIAGVAWVALPTSILTNGKDLGLAIKHELEHHRQGDTVWARWIEVLACAFFANPALYLWKVKITELQELSCDEALIGRKGVSAQDYGSCLVRVAEAALGDRRMYAGTTCMASVSGNPFHFKSFLRRRIEMFSSHGRLRAQSWAGGVGVLLGTLAAVLTVTIALGAEQALRGAKSANPGTLVVDPAIQTIADQVLSHAIEVEKAKGGFAIVADPVTGRILAVSNFDLRSSRSGHWAVGQELEQASVMKGLVVARALDAGLTSRSEKQRCENGNYLYNGRVFHDWRNVGWDSLTTDETIANSSDICSMKIAEKIGPEGLLAMLESFGFGPGGTASSLPEARAGELPSLENGLDLVPMVASGYGFKSTPLEVLQAYGAIANGGNLMMPLPADQIHPQVIRRVLSAEGARQARGVLRQVVLSGTGKPAQSTLYTTAGKTATAWTGGYLERMEKYPGEFGGYNGDYGAMIGFAPVEAPRVVVYVSILDPKSGDGAHGSKHAAPVFKEIVEKVLQFMDVPPDQPQS